MSLWKPVSTELYPDRNDKDIIAVSTQDIEPEIEQAKELRKVEQKSDWGRHVASIPNILLNALLNEEWARGNHSLRLNSPEFNELVRRKLQMEWAAFRVDRSAPMIGWHVSDSIPKDGGRM